MDASSDLSKMASGPGEGEEAKSAKALAADASSADFGRGADASSDLSKMLSEESKGEKRRAADASSADFAKRIRASSDLKALLPAQKMRFLKVRVQCCLLRRRERIFARSRHGMRFQFSILHFVENEGGRIHRLRRCRRARPSPPDNGGLARRRQTKASASTVSAAACGLDRRLQTTASAAITAAAVGRLDSRPLMMASAAVASAAAGGLAHCRQP